MMIRFLVKAALEFGLVFAKRLLFL